MMKALNESQQSASTLQELSERLRGVLVYEDFKTGTRAKAVCDHLLYQIEIAAKVTLNLWRFDLLRDSELNQCAADEAAAADIVVLSAHGNTDLPAEVNAWLARWLAHKNGNGHSALILSLDQYRHEWSSEARILASLRTMVESAGVDLIPHYGESQVDSSYPTPAWASVEVNTLAAREAMRRPSSSFKHWGINE